MLAFTLLEVRNPSKTSVRIAGLPVEIQTGNLRNSNEEH
jgi:hypothetical protein